VCAAIRQAIAKGLVAYYQKCEPPFLPQLPPDTKISFRRLAECMVLQEYVYLGEGGGGGVTIVWGAHRIRNSGLSAFCVLRDRICLKFGYR